MASINDISKTKVGESVEFQREAPNLFQMISEGEKKKELKKQQEEAKKQKEIKDFNDFIEYDSPDFWQPFDSQIKQKYDDYQDFVAEARRNGSYTDPSVLAEINKRKAEIDIYAKKTIGLKDQFKSNYKEWSDIPGVNSAKLQDYMMKSTIKNEDGTMRSQDDIVDTFDDSILYNEDLYDYNTVVKSFVDNIANVTVASLKKGGRLDEKTTTTAKSYVQLDENNNVVMNEDGVPKLNISEALVSEVMSNPAMATKVDRLVAEKQAAGFENYTKKSAVEELIRPHSGLKEAKTWSTNQAYLTSLRSQYTKKNGTVDEKFATGLLTPWAALIYGNKGWGGNELIDGVDYKIASVPLNTNQIGENEFIDKLYLGPDGSTYYTTKDKDNKSLNDGKLIKFEKTGGILSRILNYSDSITKDERDVVNKWIQSHTNEFGDISWDALVQQKTKVEETSKDVKYKSRIEQSPLFKKKGGDIIMNSTITKKDINEVGENMQELLSFTETGYKIEVDDEGDEGFILRDENDNKVEIGGEDFFDNTDADDMKLLLNYIKDLKVGASQTQNDLPEMDELPDLD
jgi:hypothetical protein